MFTREERETTKRRVGAILFAFLLHGGALGTIALAGIFLAPQAVRDTIVEIPIFRHPAPHGTSMDAGGKPATRKVARATKITKHDLVAPQVIAPVPEATPAAVAEAEPTAPGMPAGLADPCPNCTGTGSGKGPGKEPGIHGVPDSDCVGEGCDGVLDAGAAHVTPIAIFQPSPLYPASARSSGMSGFVVAEIIVGIDGRVQSARIVKSQPPFDGPALETLRSWRYQPFEYHGRPMAWRSQVTLRFQLR